MYSFYNRNKRKWNEKKVTPELIEATVTISKAFRKYLSNTPGKHKVKKLQTTVILAIAHTHTHTHTRTSESTNATVQNMQHWKYYNMYHKS
jgi:hypothetical protein